LICSFQECFEATIIFLRSGNAATQGATTASATAAATTAVKNRMDQR
jgi:hypothetical protein